MAAKKKAKKKNHLENFREQANAIVKNRNNPLKDKTPLQKADIVDDFHFKIMNDFKNYARLANQWNIAEEEDYVNFSNSLRNRLIQIVYKVE